MEAPSSTSDPRLKRQLSERHREKEKEGGRERKREKERERERERKLNVHSDKGSCQSNTKPGRQDDWQVFRLSQST
uniref:Alternative protein EMX2 n=1 Tax=Homo sapiens TaxID=9606 RepID=L8E7K8_HUMAN|nr:alternative protein EMX2 [Homo sapiens]